MHHQTKYLLGDRLSELMLGVMKETENQLRAVTKAKGKVRGYVIAPEHAAAIAEVIREGLPAFAAAYGGTEGAMALPAPLKVKVDPDQVGRLQVESDAVRGMLIEAMGGDDEPTTVPPVAPPVPPPGGATVLTPGQREALVILMAGEDIEGRLRRVADAEEMMLEVLLDEINEVASEIIGDAVVDLSGPVPALYEEYVDRVAGMVGR